MKRFLLSLITSILAFTAGLVTASSWTSKGKTELAPVAVNIAEPCIPTPQPAEVPVQSFTVTPPRDFYFGQNGLKLVPERVQLKSESLGYDVDVSYPQILGTPYTDQSKIERVNQHIKDAATKLYRWSLDPALQTRVQTQARSGIRNNVNFTYQVGLATDTFLNVNFIGYSYNGDVSRQVQDSFSANYDLSSGRHLELSELFRPRSNYLHAISTYTIFELSKVKNRKLDLARLQPTTENFDAWQITSNGITFNFHGCRIAHCGEGDMSVQIPYEELRPFLNPGIPDRFKITYP